VGYAEDSSWGVKKCVLWEALKGVNVEKAEATMASDKQNILSLVEQSGTHRVNQKVMLLLQRWCSGICWSKAHSLLEGDDIELGGMASARVARFFTELGDNDKAEQLLQKGMAKLDGAGIKCSVARAAIKTIMGFVKLQRDDEDAAYIDLKEAFRIRQEAAALDTSDAAELMECLGVAEAKRGDLQSAAEKMRLARDTRETTHTIDTPDGAGLLANSGLICALIGDFKGSEDCFQTARGIRTATDTSYTPRGAGLLAMEAVVKGLHGEEEAAMNLCQEAHDILERVSASHTRRGVDLLFAKVFILAESKEPEKMQMAVDTYSQALETLGQLHHESPKSSKSKLGLQTSSLEDQSAELQQRLGGISFLVTMLE